MQHVWFIGWFWGWAGVAAVVLLFAPLIFGGKHRLPYATAFSSLALLLVALFALRGKYWTDEANTSGWAFREPDALECFSLSFSSGSGGMRVSFIDDHVMESESLDHKPPGPGIVWYSGSPARYPKYPANGWPLTFNRWGYQLRIVNEPDRPDGTAARHRWEFVFPAYFPIPFLLIAPYLYTRRRFLIPRHRRKHNLCLNCGYPLRGLPSDRPCPECGIPPTAPKAATPTAPESPNTTAPSK